jgi:hypothetical protein
MENQDTQIYSADDFLLMATAFEIEQLPDEIKEKVTQAAEAYEWAAIGDVWNSRAELREMLKKIAKQTEKLEVVLRKLDQKTARRLDANIGPDALGILRVKAEQAREKIPKSGHEPYRARRQFVAELADIYEKATGKKPARRSDPKKGGDYGPFRDFVLAALRPIAPHETSGADGDIRAVISARNKSSG